MAKMRVQKVLRTLTLMLVCFGTSAYAQVRLGEGQFNEYVPPVIETTTVPECDSFINQLDACMKTQITPNEYPYLENGINEIRMTVIDMVNSNRRAEAVQNCNRSLEQLRNEYTSRGCTFN